MKRTSKHVTRNAQPSFVSLFSGCGGLDLGFSQAGFKCLGAFDSNAAAISTHKLNLGASGYLHDLTCDLPPFLEECPDLVLSGSPCQGFSTIGKRDFSDGRNILLLRGAQIAVKMAPRVFVSENVPAALFGNHRAYWEEIQTFLRSHGYCCTTLELNARDFGVAQVRRRIFLVAVKGTGPIELSPRKASHVSLQDVIGNLVGVADDHIGHTPRALAGDQKMIARRIRAGQKLCNVRAGERAVPTWEIPEVFGTVRHSEKQVLASIRSLRRRERVRSVGDADPVEASSIRRHLGRAVATDIASLIKKGYLKTVSEQIDFTHTFNGKFRRLSWDEASSTVDTRFGQARSFLHPSEDRGLTLREAARIQGFPDNFQFMGSVESKFRMVGNAVPPPMANALAEQVLQYLRGAL